MYGLPPSWCAELQRAAADGEPATHRAEHADGLAGREQAAVDATTRTEVDLLGQARDVVTNVAIDRDHRASGAHVAIDGAVDHDLLSGGNQIAVNRARDYDGLASGIHIAGHAAGAGHRLAAPEQVTVARFASRDHRRGAL